MTSEQSIEKIAADFASIKKTEFIQIIEILADKVESPIERAFFYAFHAIKDLEGIAVDTTIDAEGRGTWGLFIDPQFKIGPYRVDFLCSHFDELEDKSRVDTVSVIVECDSQAFHDRSEPERRNEKKRDRYLQKSGYKVFRFTGRELIDNPFLCAKEVIEFLYGKKVRYFNG